MPQHWTGELMGEQKAKAKQKCGHAKAAKRGVAKETYQIGHMCELVKIAKRKHY